MTMGTASTMTSLAEALGWTLSGAASIPAADANHQRMASATGEIFGASQITTVSTFTGRKTLLLKMATALVRSSMESAPFQASSPGGK